MEIDKTVGFTLTDHQQDIFNNIVGEIKHGLDGDTNFSIVNLNGFAGSGKSVLTTEVINYFSDYRVLCTSPTHKACKVLKDLMKENNCKNVDVKTIHSYLKLKLEDNHDTGLKELVPNLWGDDDPQLIDILVVDEKSMTSDELLSYASEKINSGMLKVILLVGDIYQLLPVDTGEISSFVKNNVENTLTEPLRYAMESPILSKSFEIKNIIDSREYMDLGMLFENIQNNDNNEFTIVNTRKEFMTAYFNDPSNDKIVINYTNKHVNRYNEYIRNLLKKNDVRDGDIETIEVGDKLIFNDTFYKNNEQLVHLNSEICTVLSCVKIEDQKHQLNYWNIIDEDHNSFPVIDFNDLEKFKKRLSRLADIAKMTKDKKERNQKWGQFFALKNKYADVSYTFSVTSHKSQGSSYESVYIDATDFDKPYYEQDTIMRLLYVAITRSRKHVNILI